MHIPKRILQTGFVCLLAGLVQLIAAPITNADVIKLVQANIDPAIIKSAIENSEPNFDTSANGLIELSTAKVPQPLIELILKAKKKEAAPVAAAPAAPAPAPAPAAAADSSAVTGPDHIAPSEAFLKTDTGLVAMRYLNPQVRTAARALGFGGVASYAVLRNSAAATRVKNKKPEFLVSVPNQAQVESYVTVASFQVRKNNSREVMIGGGYMGYSSGIHPDRIVQIRSEKAADQSKVEKGFTLYSVTPVQPMATGEYALILYTGEMQSSLGSWFSGTGNSYFDFGVDP